MTTTCFELRLHLLSNFDASYTQVLHDVTNAALDFDFAGTLQLAKETRVQWGMRKVPAQILAIAAGHPGRAKFNESNPKFFRNVVKECCILPGDMRSILNAWKALHGSKSNFPSCLKRGYCDRLSVLTPYHAQKYRKSIIDVVRLSHPHKSIVSQTRVIDELMTKGRLDGLDGKDIKWETHRSMGKSWLETLDVMNWHLPHMAALRNIRSFTASSDIDESLLHKYMQIIMNGVKSGKQFPLCYESAQDACKNSKIMRRKKRRDYRQDKEREPWDEDSDIEVELKPEFIDIISEYLEQCMQKSMIAA